MITGKDKEEAIETCKKYIGDSDTIYGIVRHVSQSGMYRVIDLYVIRDNRPLRISYSAGILLERYDEKHEGAKAKGCGMDMIFHLVYNLSYALYGATGGKLNRELRAERI